MEAFVPQLSRIQDCASADKAQAVKIIPIESLPKDADHSAWDCDHDVRKKQGRGEE
jgi:hypothetical protein